MKENERIRRLVEALKVAIGCIEDCEYASQKVCNSRIDAAITSWREYVEANNIDNLMKETKEERTSTDYLTVGDLKTILKELPDEMFVVIPVIDEDDVNRILGFRKVKTAGILECEYETENEKKVLCVNGASDGYDIADQVHFSGRDVSVTTVLYGKSNQITDEQWKNAIERLNMHVIEYASIGWTGQFGLQGVLIPLKKRFDKGERTRELYDAMMEVE